MAISNFKDIGLRKSRILFIWIVILIIYSIFSYVNGDSKELRASSSYKIKSENPKLRVHKTDKELENYNKVLFNPQNSQFNAKSVKINQVAINKKERRLKEPANSVVFNPYQVLKEDTEQSSLNKLTDNINIMIYWIDEKKLKVLSILSINQKNDMIAVITVPLFGQFLYRDKVMTIGDFYKSYGRSNLTQLLEELLEVKLENYVLIQQRTLERVSSIVGTVQVHGEVLYIAKAFEQTAAGLRKDDQDIVRALGEKLISRKMWYQIPQLVWIFSQEVETNLNGGQLWEIYKASKGMEVGKLNKKPILGIDYKVKGKEYRILLAKTYKNIIYDLTR